MTFLKKSVEALHNKLQREQAEHVRNRVAVMKINQELIKDISQPQNQNDRHDQNKPKGLKERIDELKVTFNKLGGSKKLKEIMEKMNQREKMMDMIEAQEKGGSMPSANSLIKVNMDGTQASQQLDPIIQQEIATKKAYVEKLRNQIKELRQENDILAQQHFGQAI